MEKHLCGVMMSPSVQGWELGPFACVSRVARGKRERPAGLLISWPRASLEGRAAGLSSGHKQPRVSHSRDGAGSILRPESGLVQNRKGQGFGGKRPDKERKSEFLFFVCWGRLAGPGQKSHIEQSGRKRHDCGLPVLRILQIPPPSPLRPLSPFTVLCG